MLVGVVCAPRRASARALLQVIHRRVLECCGNGAALLWPRGAYPARAISLVPIVRGATRCTARSTAVLRPENEK